MYFCLFCLQVVDDGQRGRRRIPDAYADLSETEEEDAGQAGGGDGGDDEGDVDDLELPVRPRRRSHATRAVRKREARLQAADLLKDMRVNVAESANIQREVTSILHGTQQQQPQQPPRDRRYRERHTFCEWLETTMEEIPDRVWGRFRREVTNLVFQFIDMGLEVNINEIFLIFIWASNFFVFSFGEVLVKFTIGINNW